METRIIRAVGPEDMENICLAAEIIRQGGLVALPTETVYGLGGSGLCAAAVERIYAVKGRPPEKPISLLVSGIEAVGQYAKDTPAGALRLAERFWPGPLTIVLRRRETVPDIVTAGGNTVGLRCPRHDVTLAIIRQAGVPVAAPSANLSGEPSPKCAEDVLRYFSGKIDAVVDGGLASVGIESTIVDFTQAPPKILRLGGLEIAEIEAVIGDVASC